MEPGNFTFPSHVTVTTYSDWPYSRYKKLDNGTYVGEGFAFELLELMAKKFKFTYTIIPPDVDQIGDENKGMIHQLYTKQVDMAVAFIPILSQFRNFCAYSTPLDEMDTTFLMRRPPVSSTGSGLLAPFSAKVWFFILGALLIVGPTIYIFIHLRKKLEGDSRADKFTFLTCMWFVYGALLKQGTTVAPIGDSTRLVFATWWIFITVLTSFYTANLTAFLTLSKFTLALNSLDDLADYHYQWFIIDGRSIERMMAYNFIQTKRLSETRRYYGFVYKNYDMPYATILKEATYGKVFVTDRVLAKMAIFEDYRNKTRLGMHEDQRCTFVTSEKNVLPIVRAFGFQVY
ncbi:glutamate receptor ionotropic, kainate 2 isoform X2 [Phymastichus coffea]|uniref:glutamate receptor ionotropic, kainate 2 isoform X2 n=1 Tax=Phymastichus coffea TaxID=108790 RepID=UPI00273B7C54|nr:glutamate receptor ionotropic, kainate 2 isoform X2 [Phymastichus coffea]